MRYFENSFVILNYLWVEVRRNKMCVCRMVVLIDTVFELTWKRNKICYFKSLNVKRHNLNFHFMEIIPDWFKKLVFSGNIRKQIFEIADNEWRLQTFGRVVVSQVLHYDLIHFFWFSTYTRICIISLYYYSINIIIFTINKTYSKTKLKPMCIGSQPKNVSNI